MVLQQHPIYTEPMADSIRLWHDCSVYLGVTDARIKAQHRVKLAEKSHSIWEAEVISPVHSALYPLALIRRSRYRHKRFCLGDRT